MAKILLVDDERDILTTMSGSLIKKGYDVDIFSDPQQALVNFFPNLYDLILLDIKMPEVNGFELCEKIKNIDPNAEIIFISASEFLSEAQKRKISITEKNFIRKPVTISELIEKIPEHIRIKKT